jgi:hypothetical protein
MRVRPLIYPFSLVILMFTAASGLFAACGDPRVQSQAGEDSGKAGLESKSSLSMQTGQNGSQSAALKSGGTQSTAAQDSPGLRHSTGDDGHAVGLKANLDSKGQSSTALLGTTSQGSQPAQQTVIAGCSKSDYSPDPGSADSAQAVESNRVKAACDQ